MVQSNHKLPISFMKVGMMEVRKRRYFTHNGQRLMVRVPETHNVSRSICPKIYGKRFDVPESKIDWNVRFDGYLSQRTNFVADSVLEKVIGKVEGGWAHGPDPKAEKERIRSYVDLVFDSHGRPLNPVGRTGFGPERGLLGHWGANFAADPMITWYNPNNEWLYMLAILRGDGSEEIAFPGGMDEYGSTLGGTLKKELGEETALDLDMDKGTPVYCGYVDDWRNGDHSWMETVCVHRHVSFEQAMSWKLKPGDDAKKVFRLQLTPKNIQSLYASHSEIVRHGLIKLLKSSPATASHIIRKSLA